MNHSYYYKLTLMVLHLPKKRTEKITNKQMSSQTRTLVHANLGAKVIILQIDRVWLSLNVANPFLIKPIAMVSQQMKNKKKMSKIPHASKAHNKHIKCFNNIECDSFP